MELHLSMMGATRFVFAVLVTASSGLALSLFLRRGHRRELSLLYFFLGAGAYGARLLLQAFDRWGGPGILFLTLFLPIPLILFLVETVAPEWKKAISWIVGANLALIAVVVTLVVLHLNPYYPWMVIDLFSLIELPLIIAMTFFPRRAANRDLQITRAGILIFLLFAIYSNLQGLIFRSSANLEFVGFVIVLGCLGEVALKRMARDEEHLLSLRKELEIARDIQARLLPQSNSNVAGLLVASRYIPATSVAGDFFDFICHDDGLGVLIADVSGHGIPAALSASMVKLAIRAQAADADKAGAVLQGMNSILSGNLQGQFVSAAYLFLNPAQSSLTYAGAGHPPLLVYRSCGRQVESLEENGVPLGIFAESTYTAKSAPLAPGDRCVLYTDGVLEATCPSGEEFGPERLQAFMRDHSSFSPQTFCDALMSEITLWCGAKQQPQDDLTVVAIDFPADNNGS